MNYYFIPLDSHPDYGYGMMGSIYKTTADDITKSAQYRKDWYTAYPVNYLRRHSIELFLKSGIILFHKKFNINFGGKSCQSEPQIRISNGKWQLIRNTHNIEALYQRLNELINSHNDYLRRNTKIEWKFDDNFEKWINIINGYDSASDYFRYPVTSDQQKDKRKNIFQENTVEGLQKEIARGKTLMTLLVENSEGEVIHIYNHDSSKMNEIYSALENASDQLGGFHAAVRHELFNGF